MLSSSIPLFGQAHSHGTSVSSRGAFCIRNWQVGIQASSYDHPFSQNVIHSSELLLGAVRPALELGQRRASGDAYEKRTGHMHWACSTAKAAGKVDAAKPRSLQCPLATVRPRADEEPGAQFLLRFQMPCRGTPFTSGWRIS